MATRRRHDSNEDEATAIDMREASSKIHAALARKRRPAVSPKAPTLKASGPADDAMHGSDQSGEEDTEFLARPSLVQPSAEASRTAAVPRRAEPPAAPVPPPPAALPRMPRPLPGRDEVTEARPLGGSAGPTAPRITRIFVSPEAQAAAQRRPTPEEVKRHAAAFTNESTATTDPNNDRRETSPRLPSPRAPTVLVASGSTADATDPPTAEPPRRAPTARNVVSTSSTGSGTDTLEAEPADGTLIVDVPAGAVVFVNGVERGRGPSLRVRELDRYAKHAVRVHADGFAPWKGSVSLDGRVAAKVRPNLRVRER